MDEMPCLVDLLPPDVPVDGEWKVATSLEPIADRCAWFRALSGRALRRFDRSSRRDGPLRAARVRSCGRTASDGHYGSSPYADKTRLEGDLSRICAEHAGLFGELPIDRYLFLVTAVGEGYGGFEHRFSTSLLCSRNDLPLATDEQRTEAYIRFLGLCSHEYFHLWHVKRIRPLALMEGSLDREVHTRTLWAFEGITSYYDELALVRSGRIDAKTYVGLACRDHHSADANPWTGGADPGRIELRCLDQVLQAGRECPERHRQLLCQGRLSSPWRWI
jgi:predicted metalloprotease with PDZ domain